MAYTRITATKNGRAAIQYAKGCDGKGHNGNNLRNQMVSEVNLFSEDVESYESQMQRFWNKASSRNKNQVRRIIQSFSKKELNPNSENDIGIANEIGVQFAKEAYPNRQVIVFTQTDGESGLIHNHIIVNNVDMMEYKGCTDEQTKFRYVKERTNEIAKDYINLDTGEHTADKVTQNERHRRAAGKYVWKDDLKTRIKSAMKDAKSRDEFVERLSELGVETEIRQRKRGRTGNKEHDEYIVYELQDISHFGDDKIPVNLKSKGKKLGTDYDLEHLDEMIAKNQMTVPVKAPVIEEDIMIEDESSETIIYPESEKTVQKQTEPVKMPVKEPEKKTEGKPKFDYTKSVEQAKKRRQEKIDEQQRVLKRDARQLPHINGFDNDIVPEWNNKVSKSDRGFGE